MAGLKLGATRQAISVRSRQPADFPNHLPRAADPQRAGTRLARAMRDSGVAATFRGNTLVHASAQP
jgi:hypothetical protein